MLFLEFIDRISVQHQLVVIMIHVHCNWLLPFMVNFAKNTPKTHFACIYSERWSLGEWCTQQNVTL